jgi:autotransporter-associated beta strand protein
MENLGRGAVATRTSATEVLVSWRLLGLDPEGIAFNLYRSADGGVPEKLNPAPLAAGTNFVDATANPAVSNAYHVTPVMDGRELAPGAPCVLPAGSPVSPVALRIPLIPRSGYYTQHAWVGDLDGDGEYDFVVARLPASADNNQYVEAYKNDGAHLWTVDLGPQSRDHNNITPGPATISVGHNDCVTVYDLNSDGRAEVIIKTANGVKFGDSATLTHSNNLDQWISVLDGLTGAEITRTPIPDDFKSNGTITGHFGIMYCDGEHPSFVYRASNRRPNNGSFDVMFITWDWDAGTQGLKQRWKFRKDQNGGERLADAHQIRVIDVDGDGRDEVTPGGYMIKSDGTLLWALDPEVVHGDRYHITDMDPSRPGLEGYYIQQSNPSLLGMVYYDARTGALLRKHYIPSLGDLGRGIVADVDPRHPGYEYWSFTGMFNAASGEMLSPEPQRPWPNFRIWWDGTVMSNLFNHTTVDRWDYENRTPVRLLSAANYGAVKTTRDASPFYGDIIGDWREEILYENSAGTELMIFTTPYPSDVRLYTLPHNRAYRMAMNLKGYMQSHHVDYYLGHGMAPPPAPNIRLAGNAPVITLISDDTGRSSSDFTTTSGNIILAGAAAPGATVSLVLAGAGEIASLSANPEGVWSHDYGATTLPEGKHYFEITATKDGLTTASPIVTVTVDRTAPLPPTVVRADAAAGALSGTAEAGALVTVLNAAATLGIALADAGGNWTLILEGGLPAGPLPLSATAEDLAGNVSAASATLTINTTLTAPAITGISPDTGASATDGITHAASITLQGAAPTGALVRLTLGPGGETVGSTTAADGAWSIAWDGSALPDGQYAFYATVSADGADSPASAAFIVTLDRAPPQVKSIARHDPESETFAITIATITYRVEFEEDIHGLAAGHFTLATTDTATGVVGTVIPVSARVYDVTVGSLDGTGSLRLDLIASAAGLTDTAGNAAIAAYTAGASYTRALTTTGDGVWMKVAGGLWSDGASWDRAVIADDEGEGFFDTLDIEGAVTVTLDTPRTVKGLYFGDTDTTTPGFWTLSGNGNPDNKLTFSGGATLGVATGAHLTLQAPLAGTLGLTKADKGTLLLQSDSRTSLTGNLTAGDGLLKIGEGGALRVGTVGVTDITGGAELNIDGGSLVATGMATVNVGHGSVLTIDSGTARFEGGLRNNNSSGAVVRVRGGSLYASDFSMRRSHAENFDYATGMIVTGGEAEIGTLNVGTDNSGASVSVEGGKLAVTGQLTLGNQSSNNRGGALRVMSGTFISTHAAKGIVLGARAGVANRSELNILGGKSLVERVTFGDSATITSGRGTLLVNGGTLYIGASGLVRNAASGYTATITLREGVLGAQASWSTTMPVTLDAAGSPETLSIHAADHDSASFDITLNGVLSGDGGFAKTGAGALTLAAANTFTGPVDVNEGTLNINGSLAAATAAVTVAGGATLTGTGVINRPVTLQDGAILALDPDAPLALAAGRLLTKTGTTQLLVSIMGGIPSAGAHTLATFGSTTLTDADFAPISDIATVQVSPTSLELVVITYSTLIENAITAAKTLRDGATPGDAYGQYPQDAINALTVAIAAAETASTQPGVTDAQIIDAIVILQTALETFAKAQIDTTVDFATLDAALADADALLDGAAGNIGAGHGQYPQHALDVLGATIDTVKSVRGKPAVTQTEIATALTALQNAMEAFEAAVISVDFLALTTAIIDANALHSTALAAGAGEGHGQHSQTDITTLATAIDAAQTVAETPAVTQTEVDIALDALQGVITAFTSAISDVDFSALDAEIATAATLLATVTADASNIGNGHGQYPQPAIDTFAAAIATAQAASGQPGITPTQVAGELGTLQPAAATFKAARVVVDFSALETAIDTAATLRLRAIAGEGHGQHAQAAIDALADAIDAAFTAAAAPTPTQTAINDARDMLLRAVEVFESAVQIVDFSALTTAITGADTLLATATIGAAAGEYPQSAVDAFAAVIGTVKAVAGKLGVTQTEADTARRMLENAMADFEAAQITAADVAAPRITRHPVAQTVRPGATASFTAAATGPGLRYQWQKDGVDIASATTDALFIINAKSADAGVYRVIVTNDHGETTSNEARLTLEEPPGDGGGGAPTWWLLALLAALLTLRVLHRRHV